MSEISTKREDVERLAHGSENYNGDWLVDHSIEIAATLRALLDERDAAVVRAERWDTEAAAARVIIPRLETERDDARMCAESEAQIADEFNAERDAALAEVARLREALERIANQEWVENCLDPQWPARIARAALAGGPR